MSDVFISYSRHDKNLVFPFVKSIEQKIGTVCWIDLEGIESGSQFEDVIVSAIDASKVVLFMLSDHSLVSKWTKREVLYAEGEGKRIVPVVVDGKGLRKWFKFHFGNVDYVDIYNQEQKEKLYKDLVTWLGVGNFPKNLSDDFHGILKKENIHDKRWLWKTLLVAIVCGCLICCAYFINKIIPCNEKESPDESVDILQNVDSVKRTNSGRGTQKSVGDNSSASQTSTDTIPVNNTAKNEKNISKPQTASPKETAPRVVSMAQKDIRSLHVYDVDELMKLATSGDPRAYVPLAKYYYRNASGMSSYERVHIYSMKAINANVDVAEAKKLINNIESLGFYVNNEKYQKPNL